jgi:hypothetical protein
MDDDSLVRTAAAVGMRLFSSFPSPSPHVQNFHVSHGMHGGCEVFLGWSEACLAIRSHRLNIDLDKYVVQESLAVLDPTLDPSITG